MRQVGEIFVGGTHKSTISDTAFTPDERKIVSVDGEMLGVWCLSTGSLLYSLPAVCFAIAPDDDLLAVVETNSANDIKLIGLGDGRTRSVLPLPLLSQPSGRRGGIKSLVFSPKGDLLAAAQRTGCYVLQMPTGKPLFTVPPDHMNGPYYSQFIPNAALVAVRHYHTIDIWDVLAQRQAAQVKASEIDDHFAISPDGGNLACSWGWSGNKNVVEVYSLKTYDRLPLSIRSETIVSLAYSPDGQWLAGCGGTFEASNSAGEVAVVQLWDAKTVKLLRTIRLDEQETMAWGVCFSPTSGMMACSVNPVDGPSDQKENDVTRSRIVAWQMTET